MHKGIILLVKAINKKNALNKVKAFMNEYESDIWDWYVIGGRWSGTLIRKFKEFYNIVKKRKIKIKFYSDIEKKETQIQLQNIWEKELKQKSLNPVMRDTFLVYQNKLFVGMKYYTDNEYKDDIKPLKDCIDIVNDWNAENILQQKFCFDTNVFNIEKYNYSIPKDIKNYYAVIVDMHN